MGSSSQFSPLLSCGRSSPVTETQACRDQPSARRDCAGVLRLRSHVIGGFWRRVVGFQNSFTAFQHHPKRQKHTKTLPKCSKSINSHEHTAVSVPPFPSPTGLDLFLRCALALGILRLQRPALADDSFPAMRACEKGCHASSATPGI